MIYDNINFQTYDDESTYDSRKIQLNPKAKEKIMQIRGKIAADVFSNL